MDRPSHRALARNLFILLTLPLFSGCYLLRQGAYVIRYTSRARPIERVLGDPSTPDSTRRFLALVNDIRQFARDSLGLKRNDNYTKYTRTDRNHLVDVVSASQRFSFTQHRWSFPFFGSFPYKGYFDSSGARKEARKLEARGYDVHIGRVDAFSTLGFFSDPVYSFMQRFPVYDIAQLIIHEQTHATVYLKNQTRFNEELATFLGNAGALAFIRSRCGDTAAAYRDALDAQADFETYRRLVRELHDRLDSVYRSGADTAAMAYRKDSVIAAFKGAVNDGYDTLFRTRRFSGLHRATINNASIAIQMTYTQDLTFYEELYERCGRDLPLMVTAAAALKRVNGDPRAALAEALRRLQPP